MSSLFEGISGINFTATAVKGGGGGGGTFPAGTFPAGTFPAGTFPAGTFPAGTFPAGTFPNFMNEWRSLNKMYEWRRR